jgi:hypothetical protein
MLKYKSTKKAGRIGGRLPIPPSARFAINALWVLVLLPLSVVTGCAKNYGRVQFNPDMTAAFVEKQPLPDYRYYYCGRFNQPWAIVGIEPGIQFETRLWSDITNKNDIYRMVDTIRIRDYHYSRAADILDASGGKIGIYFSNYTQTTVEDLGDNRITVYCPYAPGRAFEGRNGLH